MILYMNHGTALQGNCIHCHQGACISEWGWMRRRRGWNWIDWWLPSCKCLLVHYHSLPIQSSSTLLLIIIVFLFLFMNLYREDDGWETFPFWQVPCSFTCSFHSESMKWAFLRTTEWFRQHKPKLMVRRRLCLKTLHFPEVLSSSENGLLVN